MNLQDRIDPPVEPTAPVGGWEKQFDNLFNSIGLDNFPVYSDDEERTPRNRLKTFISQTIKNREREIAEGVEVMKRATTNGSQLVVPRGFNLEKPHDLVEIAVQNITDTHNKALDDVLALINKQ